MVYYDGIVHTYACQHSQTTDMRNSVPLADEALLSISAASCGQLVKMLITLEPHGVHVFKLIFASYIL